MSAAPQSRDGAKVRQIRPRPQDSGQAPPIVAGQYGTDGRTIFRRVQVKDAGGEPAGWAWETFLGCDVRFITDRRPALDPDFGDDIDADDLPEGTSDVEVTLAGQDTPLVFRNMSASDLTKAKFLDKAGRRAFLGLTRSPTQATRGEIFNAINELSEKRSPREDVFYPVTGWHAARNGGGEFFVTGQGAIGPDGIMPEVVTRIDPRLAVYTPQDAPSGPRLLEAFDCWADLADAIPGRILTPLMAARLRAPYGTYRGLTDLDGADGTVPVCNITGNTGAGKSGAQAATANINAPGIRHNSMPFKCGDSGKMAGASGPGMETILYKARDLVIDWDDLDPNDTEEHRAAWHSQLIRRVAGQQARVLSTREGNTRHGKPARCGVVISGEPFSAQESAENRAINIDLRDGDIRISRLAALTGPDERGLRSELGGGIIRAIAADRAGRRKALAGARVALRSLFAAGDVPGPVARGADCFAELAATAYDMLLILRENGMTARDARDYWRIMVMDLREAWAAHLAVIGQGTRSARAIGLISEGISSGTIMLASAKDPTAPPPDPRYHRGWTVTADGAWRKPVVSGYVDDRGDDKPSDLLLLPKMTTSAIRSLEAGAGGSWSGGVKTLASSLKSEGAVTGVAASRAKTGEVTDQVKLGDGSRPRVWRIPIVNLDADDQDQAVTDYSGPVDYSAITGGPEMNPEADLVNVPTQTEPAAEPAAEVSADPPSPILCTVCGKPLDQSYIDAGFTDHGEDAPAATTEPSEAKPEPAKPVAPQRARAAREQQWTATAGAGTRRAPARRTERESMPQDQRLAMFTRDVRADKENPGHDASDRDIRLALFRWEKAMAPFRYEAPAHKTGVVLFHWLESRNGSSPDLPIEDSSPHVAELSIHRNLSVTGPEAIRDGMDWLTSIDVNAQYPNGARVAYLPIGTPEWVTGRDALAAIPVKESAGFRPGYVSFTDPGSLPAPFNRVPAGRFITTHEARLLAIWADRGRCSLPEIDRALLWPAAGDGSRRWLRTTAQFFLDARDRLERQRDLSGQLDLPNRIALRMVKSGYARFFGGMLASGPENGNHNRTKTQHYPWRDMVHGQARFLMWLSLGEADRVPALVKDPDGAYFLVGSEGEMPGGLALDSRPGKWKLVPDRIFPVTGPIREAIATGTPDKAHRLIVAEAKARKEGRSA